MNTNVSVNVNMNMVMKMGINMNSSAKTMSDSFRGRRQRPQAWESADPVGPACGEVWGHGLYGRRTNGAVT